MKKCAWGPAGRGTKRTAAERRAARAAAASGWRLGVAAVAIAGLAGLPTAGRGECPPPAGDTADASSGVALAGCGDDAVASAGSAAAGTVGSAIVSREAEGRRELELAQKSLAEAEQATDDATRRARYKAAEEHATRAIELLPGSADAHFAHFGAAGRLAQLDGLATAAFQLRSLNKQLDEVLRLDPNHANALAARGGMLVKLPRIFGGDSKQGIAYLERAVSLDSTAVGKRLELAEAYNLVGRQDDAKRTAAEALAMAETMQDPAKIETSKRFIEELNHTCSGCSMKSIGR